MGIQAPTKQVTQLAIQKLNNNKAPGIYGLVAAFLMHGSSSSSSNPFTPRGA